MLQVVWFKRDLRVQDHAALAAAAQRGPVLPLYVVEPEAWQQPDASARQWDFVRESLLALRTALTECGQPLVVRESAMLPLLERLRRRGPFALHSHEETGNDWSFQRDRAVRAYCRTHGLSWTEYAQNGVIRALRDRDGWTARWESFMARALAAAPALAPLSGIEAGEIPLRPAGLAADECPGRQTGGRPAGLAVLEDFLTQRVAAYPKGLSSPLRAETACSRLSPHLAWGTLSLREVTQATRLRMQSHPASRRALRAFDARLHWHCHFMQKLESEPALEFRNLHRAYDGLRDAQADPQRLAAWCEGRTGWPFVDACMRSLRANGWINFRMRAMLMSVASQHLWLHWREPGLHLARCFTDYEPGIHWPQVQMQSGTTGINTIRLYNPIKQGFDQDPQGIFIRRWVPELRAIPDLRVHTPWRLTATERAQWAPDYPLPLRDADEAAREARARVWGVRQGRDYREAAERIQHQHGSRRAGLPPTRARRTPPAGQGRLFEDPAAED